MRRGWLGHRDATWHGHPARDVHGQDGHATRLVGASRRDVARASCP